MADKEYSWVVPQKGRLGQHPSLPTRLHLFWTGVSCWIIHLVILRKNGSTFLHLPPIKDEYSGNLCLVHQTLFLIMGLGGCKAQYLIQGSWLQYQLAQTLQGWTESAIFKFLLLLDLLFYIDGDSCVSSSWILEIIICTCELSPFTQSFYFSLANYDSKMCWIFLWKEFE